MKIKFTGRKIDVTQGLKDYAERKLARVDKYFADDADATVTFSVQKDNQIVEITIFHNGMIFRSEVSNADMYASIDRSIDVLERQIRKQKTRLEKRLKSGAFAADLGITDVPIEEEEEFKIVKTKTYTVKPMSAEEAILQMNLLGHSFYVFSNDKTNEKNVVYKRKDGNYGLIELE
ncbi:MAG: ribosome-associated translation inhibitor RaiA [Ruminococcaceae bacterium]|nr:ribosome-associated translation inhibitor RaiA [Oscillospiraceae bacterium]